MERERERINIGKNLEEWEERKYETNILSSALQGDFNLHPLICPHKYILGIIIHILWVGKWYQNKGN